MDLNQAIPAPIFERQRANPKNVAAIILGGGAGAQLFPLTSRAATPAVRKCLIITPLLICFIYVFKFSFSPSSQVRDLLFHTISSRFILFDLVFCKQVS